MSKEQLYYIQDSRSYCGNSMFFWCKDGRGYTTDPREAERCTLEEAQRWTRRETDIFWPVEHIDSLIRHHVDHQYLDYDKMIKVNIK